MGILLKISTDMRVLGHVDFQKSEFGNRYGGETVWFQTF